MDDLNAVEKHVRECDKIDENREAAHSGGRQYQKSKIEVKL